MHVPPPQASLNVFTAIAVGPVNVEFAGVIQSIFSFQTFNTFGPKETTYSGAPAGAVADPSMSAASNPPFGSLKHCIVFAWPARSLLPSKPQTVPPLKDCPFWNML